MGLRSCAEAVLIGAGTFRAAANHVWDAPHIHPPRAAEFAELRARLGLSPRPMLVVVSGSGELDPAHPALREPALILISASSEARLRAALPAQVRVLSLGEGRFDPARALAALRAEGLQLILTEGGPTLVGGLLSAGLLDELFLTSSPLLLGRRAGDERKALIEAAELRAPLELLSARRQGSHLFLRYAVSSAEA